MSKIKKTMLCIYLLSICFTTCFFNCFVYGEITHTNIKSKTIKNLDSGLKQHIVVYGTSLTSDGAWVKMLQEVLNKRYPGQVTLTNSGGPGKNSDWGVLNLDQKVLNKNPDTVFIEFAINDTGISVKKSQDNLKKIINEIKNKLPNCEIILMTMNPFYGKLFDGYYIYINEVSRLFVPRYNKYYREIAKEQNLILIDIEKEWKRLEKKDRQLIEKYVPDGLHPTNEACKEVILPEILKVLFR